MVASRLKATKKILIVLGIAGTLVALGGLVLVLVGRNPERRVARLLTEAQIYKRTGRLDLEGEKLEAALAVMPRDAGLMAKLARNLRARGELDRAEQLFRDSLAANPDDLAAGFDDYDLLVARGRFDEAQKILEHLDAQAKVAAAEAYRDRVLSARADMALRRGERKKAIAALEGALGANPALDAPIRLTLASVLADEGELARAEDLARSLWEARKPKDLPAPRDDQERLSQEVRFATEPAAARAALLLGSLIARRGATDEAAHILAEGFERAPDDVPVAQALAAAEVARGRFDAALEVAKRLEARKLAPAALLVRGRVALARGDAAAARKAFTDAASAAPGAAEPALAAAQSALDAGDKSAAKRLALSIDTKEASLGEKVARCRILRDCGETKAAREELAPVLATAPGDSDAVDLLVRLALDEGKPDLAAKELDALEARVPGDRSVARARTLLALWTANPEEAVKLSRDSVATQSDAGSLPVLAAALALEGGVGAAARELERLSEKAPDEGVRIRARLQAAELYRALGRGDLAVPILEKGVAEHPLTKDLRIALARVQLVLGRAEAAERTLAPLLDGAGDPAAILLAASAAQSRERFDAAIALARRVEKDPVRGVEAAAVIALAARQKHDAAGARAAFARLRDLRPSAPLGYVGALADLEAQPAEAAAVLRKACDLLGPRSFGLAFAVALDLSASDDEAVSAARAAFEQSPKDAGAALVYAAALLRRGRSEEASRALAQAGEPAELRAAFAALPRESLGAFEALIALRRHGLDAEAAVFARRLIEKAPENVAVALHAARALEAAGAIDEARRALARAVAARPEFGPCRLELGYVLGKMPQGKEAALDAFEKGAAALPEDEDLQLARGMALDELGRAADAQAAYRKVLTLDAKSAIARNNLAWLLLRAGQLDEALALATSAVQDAPGSAAALDTLARIQLAKGDAKSAVATAQKAASLAPLDATIRLTFAKALDGLERRADAANQYEVALLLASSFEGRDEAEKRLAALRGKGE